MRSLPLISSLLIAVAVTIAGCTSSDCDGNRNSLPMAGFFSSTANPEPVSLDSVSIYAIGAPYDDMLEDSVRGLRSVYLPFNLESGSTSFVFKYLSSEAPKPDTITLDYKPEPYFVSEACGAVYIYHLLGCRTTYNAIDSVAWPSKIDNTPGVNIRIYFRTADES